MTPVELFSVTIMFYAIVILLFSCIVIMLLIQKKRIKNLSDDVKYANKLFREIKQILDKT